MSLSLLSLGSSDLYVRRKGISRENSVDRVNAEVYEELEEWFKPPPVPPRNFSNFYSPRDSELRQFTTPSGY